MSVNIPGPACSPKKQVGPGVAVAVALADVADPYGEPRKVGSDAGSAEASEAPAASAGVTAAAGSPAFSAAIVIAAANESGARAVSVAAAPAARAADRGAANG
ncbi:MAG: hypothetical protein JWO31_1519, partial [Phycisphaerales bacterium]|nr:hypothetical protein [Phycisphaerales bacterium]